jgi:hypothetical protein
VGYSAGIVAEVGAQRDAPIVEGKQRTDRNAVVVEVFRDSSFLEAATAESYFAAFPPPFAAKSSARASARGLVRSLWGLGRRLIARGSTRLGRSPTRLAAITFSCMAAKLDKSTGAAAVAWSQAATTAANAAAKLNSRGKRSRAGRPSAGRS